MDWSEIGVWVLAVIAALATAGLVFKLSIGGKSKTTTSNTTRHVTQNNNVAGRDIVAGDSIDNSKR